MTRYEAWVHEILGIYAVRLEKGQITGISGPLPLNAAPEADHLAGLEYDDRAAVVRRVRERLEEWFEFEPFLRGRYAPAWPPRSVSDRAADPIPLGAARQASALLEAQSE